MLNDLVGNIHAASGIDGWLLRLAGFAGDDAQIPRVVKMALVKDTADLRAQLLEWAELPGLDASSCRTAIQSKASRSVPFAIWRRRLPELSVQRVLRQPAPTLRAGVRRSAPAPIREGHQRGRREKGALEIAERTAASRIASPRRIRAAPLPEPRRMRSTPAAPSPTASSRWHASSAGTSANASVAIDVKFIERVMPATNSTA